MIKTSNIMLVPRSLNASPLQKPLNIHSLHLIFYHYWTMKCRQCYPFHLNQDCSRMIHCRFYSSSFHWSWSSGSQCRCCCYYHQPCYSHFLLNWFLILKLALWMIIQIVLEPIERNIYYSVSNSIFLNLCLNCLRDFSRLEMYKDCRKVSN